MLYLDFKSVEKFGIFHANRGLYLEYEYQNVSINFKSLFVSDSSIEVIRI